MHAIRDLCFQSHSHSLWVCAWHKGVQPQPRRTCPFVSSVHILTTLFFLLSFEASLYILDTSPLLGTWLANIFSLSMSTKIPWMGIALSLQITLKIFDIFTMLSPLIHEHSICSIFPGLHWFLSSLLHHVFSAQILCTLCQAYTQVSTFLWCNCGEQRLRGAGAASGWEEIPHIQGQEQWLWGATPRPRSGAAAVRRYPTSKVRNSGCALLEEPWRDTPCPR